jgi:SET domain-containing protein
MKANRNLAHGLQVAKSSIDGKGCFATVWFGENQQIAEYVGERISLAEAECRRRAPGKKCICDVDHEWSIDGSSGGNGTQYINHSCDPNSYLVISNGRVFLHALREIIPGDEITTDYQYEMGLDGTRCNCQTSSCLEKVGLTTITNEDELKACALSPSNRPTSRPTKGGS